MLAEGLGVLAFSLSFVWPVVRGRRLLLGIQALASLLWAAHYVALGDGAYTGALMCLLGVVQSLTASVRTERWAQVIFWLTLPALISFVLVSWAGPQSACAAGGLFVSALGRWETHPIRMRLLFLLSLVGWAGHNLIVGSVFALSADTLAFIGNGIGIYRERRAGGSVREALRPLTSYVQCRPMTRIALLMSQNLTR